MNWDRFWWAICCTLMLWGCVIVAVAVVAAAIYVLWAFNFAGSTIFLILFGTCLVPLTFWKAWKDYPQYNP